MNNSKQYATTLALNGTGIDSDNGGRILSATDKSTGRSFGVTELWRLRQNARMFKIHNRIPRL